MGNLKENRFRLVRLYLSNKIGVIITQKELADSLEISQSYIAKLESGEKPPTYSIAAKLQEEFGIPIKWFVKGEGPAPWELDKKLQGRESKVLPFRKAPAPGPGELTYESLEVDPDIPPMPKDLSGEERKRWERNAGTLRRWAISRPREALMVPTWACGRFCREVVGFYKGGKLEDVTGILKDFIEEKKK